MSAIQHAPRILVVDDDESVRTFAERALRDPGYEVMGASGGPEALRLVEQQRPFDLFVIDVTMPEMSGPDLACQLRHADRNSKILYFTGNCDHLFTHKTTLWENEAFIEKPVTMKGLLEAVSLLLYQHTRGPQMARRRAEQATVLAAELRRAFVPDTPACAACVKVFVQHQLPCLLQTQLLLVLQRAHASEGAEMLPERRGAHVRAISQFVPVQRLNEVLLEPCDGPRDLLARRPCGDQPPELRAVRTC